MSNDSGEKGYAQFIFDSRDFERLIQLPPGVHIRGVYWDAAWAAWRIHLAGVGLPPCEQGAMPDVLHCVGKWYQVAPHEFVKTFDYLLGEECIAHIGWEHDVSNNPAVEVVNEEHGS